MLKSKLIPYGCLVLSLAVFSLITAMSCTRIAAPLAPVSLTPLPSTPATATATPAAILTPTPAPTSVPTPEGHFQNFEENNGTPDNIFFEAYGGATGVFTSTAYEGSRALQVTESHVAAGYVNIYPISSNLDLSGNTNIWIMVNAPVSGLFLNLTMVDSFENSDTLTSATSTVAGTWVMITWPLSGYDVNLSNIWRCVLNLSNPGVYYLDDMRFGNF